MRGTRKENTGPVKSRHIAQHHRCNTDEMHAELKPAEAKLILVGFQSGVAESQEHGEGGNSCGRQWTEQRSDVGNAGKGDTVQRQNDGQEVQPPEKMAGKSKKLP